MEANQENQQIAVTVSVFLNTSFLILTVAGNFLVLLVLGRACQLRAPVRLLLANLAVPDLVLGGFVLPYVVHTSLNGSTESTNENSRDYSNSEGFCQAVGFIRVLCLAGSSFTLFALSYERYVAIAYPFKHMYLISVETVLKYALVIWILAALVAVLPFLGLGQYRYSPHQFVCWPEGNTFNLVFFFVVFCTTLFTMVFLYLCIFRAVRKRRSIIHALVIRIAQGFTGQKVEKFRATTTISLVLGIYSLTWAPFCFTHVFSIHSSASTPMITTQMLTTCLLYANSACNPWIYCGLNAKFRETFKKTARSCWKWVRVVFSAPTFVDTNRTSVDNPLNIRVVVIKPTNTSQLNTEIRLA
ncbi:dopamine D2-like receptor [Patiria miniata]|uniref:G-protein coupled receptors family 1 profile domain-containing protein n=1 Tax=Patiria miniata TaxID=46514 RepID=A0A914BNL0_PATMI|nr:dopamine D2-like receptor [Patiria miniata]